MKLPSSIRAVYSNNEEGRKGVLASIPERLGTEVAQARWRRIAARDGGVNAGVPKQNKKENSQCRKDKTDVADGFGGY